MRWKTAEKIKSGDVNYHRYFALWPTELSDGYTVWLESYWAKEVWHEDTYDGFYGWKTVYTSIAHPERPITGSYPNSKYRTRNTGDY